MTNAICRETGLRKYGSKFDAQNAGVKLVGKAKIGKDRSSKPLKYSTYPCSKCKGWHVIVIQSKPAAVAEEVRIQEPVEALLEQSSAKRAIRGFTALFKNLREGRYPNLNR